MGTASSFLGRESERLQVLELLRTERMVTLTGPGGIGKTRLAAEIAESIGFDYPGGVATVSLVAASAGEPLADYAARHLGFESLDAFRIGAAGQPSLVVLDNCEHVRDEAQALCRTLSDDADVTLLLTSRVALGLAAERVVEVGPLVTPTHEEPTDAVQLFLDRAAAAGAEWQHTPENLGAVAEIVRQVDGLPLAIELAAARSRVVAPPDLLTYLGRQLDLLEGDTADDPGRRRSIRSTVHASYAPLTDDEQSLFRLLGVVPGGADLELIQAMTPDVDALKLIDALTSLARHSLVTVDHHEDGSTTYRQLEPIRAFAREQLDVRGEEAAAEQAYIAAVTAFADATLAAALKSFSASVLDRIAARFAHLIAAVELATKHDDDAGRAYRLYLLFYAPTRAPRRELAELGRRIREAWPDADAPLRAEAHAVMAHSAMWGGTSDARDLARTALDDNRCTALGRVIAHRVLAFSAGHADDRAEARRQAEAAMDAAAELGSSFSRELHVTAASFIDDHDAREEVIATLQAQERAAASAGEAITVVWAIVTAAHHQLLLGDLDGAMQSAERSLDRAAASQAPWTTSASLRLLAAVLTMRRDWDAALSRWSEAFASVVAVGDVEGVLLTIRSAAGAAEYVQEREFAERLWAIVPSEGGRSALPPLFAQQHDDLRERVPWGTVMDLPQIVREAQQIFEAPNPVPTTRPSGSGGPIRFGAYELDPSRRSLRHRGEPVHVEPQVFAVLVMLASRPQEVVTKAEILDEVWSDRFVSPSALTSRIKSARAAIGDDGTRQSVIRTIHGEGFMFVAPIT